MKYHRMTVVYVVVCFSVTVCSATTPQCQDAWPSDHCWQNLRQCNTRSYQTSCKKTCGMCGDCKDAWGAKYCWEHIENCNHSNYQNGCKKMCGVCDACKDLRDDCTRLTSRCSERLIQVACRRTCASCGVVVETDELGRDGDTTTYAIPTEAASVTIPQTGVWSDWSSWSECSRSCGRGSRERIRTCTTCSERKNCERPCGDKLFEEEFCNFQACPGWGKWTTWTECSRTCGNATRSRLRMCSGPHGSCQGDPVETSLCSLPTCCASRDGVWANWGSWSTCSKTCGAGQRTRTRACFESGCGQRCGGQAKTVKSCNLQPCPRQPALPVITTNSSTWPLTAGVTVIFTCTSRYLGYPPGTLTWEISKPDARTKPVNDISTQLEVVNVTAEDDGMNVTCRVTSEPSPKKVLIVLRVEQKAVLGDCKVSFNSDNWIIMGYCDVMKIYASNPEQPICQWIKQKSIYLSERVQSSLNLSSVAPGRKLQAGKCSFEEKLPSDFPQYNEKTRQLTYKMYVLPGKTWSDAITLSIVSPQTPTLSCPTEVLPVGSQLVCTCNTSHLGAPEGRLLLFANNRLAQTGDYGQKLITLSRDLRREDDKTRVHCILQWAKNVTAEWTQIVKLLYAPDPPTLTLKNSLLEVNGFADFLCIAGGGYGLSLVLLKVTGNGTRLISSSPTTRLAFRLHNTKCEDTGNYYCQAENSLGQASSAFVQLYVSCSPQLLGNTKTTYQAKVTEGSKGQFAFELIAHPVPTIDSVTCHVGDVVSSSEQEPVRSGLLSGQCDRHVLNLHLVVCTLNITAPTDRDGGSYNVKVGNSLGSMNVAFKLRVIDQENPDTTSLLPWIGMVIGLLLVAWIAAFIVILIRRQKGALIRKADKKRILCDTGISAEEPMHYNVAANTVARQPSDEHVTSVTSVSENVYLNVEKDTSSHNRDESTASHATAENFQSDLYAVVDRTTKTGFSQNAGKPAKPAPVSKPKRTSSLSPRQEVDGGADMSGLPSAVEKSEGDNVRGQNVSAAPSKLQPTSNKEGLVYAELDFSEYQPDRQRPLPQKQETNYATIAFSRAGDLTA